MRTPFVFCMAAWMAPLSSLAQAPGSAKLADTLLLKDFKPRSVLRIPAHEVPKARFPVIDVHNHVNDGHGA